jgi:predicted aldo/keto reductase-like oxidoreductase
MNRKSPAIDRRSFLKKGLLGAASLSALSALPATLRAEERQAESSAAQKPAKGSFITRKLGKTGLTLPVVSFGVMNADNDNLVRAALDAGIVLLDTAYAYQRGRNEEMIGRVIQGRPRDSYLIATKIQGTPRDNRTGLFSAETKGETFLEMLETSLSRLGLDYVDMLSIHNVSYRDSVLFEPLMKALETAKKSGKTRFVGVSTHSNEHEVIRAAVESKFYDIVIAGHNFRKTNQAEFDAAVAEANKAGVGIIAMKTLAGGYWDKERQQPINTKAALKWALQNPGVTTAIPGMTTFDQLDLNMTVVTDITLTEEEKKDLKLGPEKGGLYCQQCNECLAQCPRELPIPSLMRSYMYAYGYRNLGEAYDLLLSLGVSSDPCEGCGKCAVSCAQGFDVKDRMTDIARLKNTPAEFFA